MLLSSPCVIGSPAHSSQEPPKFDVNDEEKALVVASTLEQDVSWLPQIPSEYVPSSPTLIPPVFHAY